MNKIKTIIVDDSAVVREVLTNLLNSDINFEVIDTAPDPIFALKKMEKNWPDLIVLDLEMPRMSGMDFLRQIMNTRPTAIVICSTLVQSGSAATFTALASGAMAVIPKPEIGLKSFLLDSNQLILQTLKEAAQSKFKVIPNLATVGKQEDSDKSKDLSKVAYANNLKFELIAIGASTGGTQALEIILTNLPKTLPGIVIVQHMPEKFTAAFAQRLNGICQVEVREAKDGDEVKSGVALIAPGNRHLVLVKEKNSYFCQVKDGPAVGYHKPSVDVLFRSVAKEVRNRALGVILTGMGRDGSKGMAEMKNAGAYNIAQSAASCVVYSMPKEAVLLNAVDLQIDLNEIADSLIKLCG